MYEDSKLSEIYLKYYDVQCLDPPRLSAGVLEVLRYDLTVLLIKIVLFE